jgi:hypothetical protein
MSHSVQSFGVVRFLVVGSAIGTVFGGGHRTFGEDRGKSQSTPIRNVTEIAKQIFTQAFEGAVPQRERDFRDQVILPIIEGSKNPSEQYSLYCHWMIAEEASARLSKLHLISSTDVFCGTADESSRFELSTVYTETTPSEKEPMVMMVVRVARERRRPTAILIAVVRAEQAQTTVYYSARKCFEFDDGKWRVKSSKITKLSNK